MFRAHRPIELAAVFMLASAFAPRPASAVEIVRDGAPCATIVIAAEVPAADGPAYAPAAPPRKRKPAGPKKGKGNPETTPEGPDAEAATLLAEWVRKMTGATLPIADEPAAATSTIYVGYAAIAAGLKVDGIDSPSREGVRIVADDQRILIAGQTAAATTRAVCRFLEHFGCRIFMDGDIGEVYPQLASLDAGQLDITEQPGFLMRNPKGPSWRGGLWKTWNGMGGTQLGHSHSWGGYVPVKEMETHPEYFALRADGTRATNGWLCTTDPGLREHFTQGVLAKIKAGDVNPSLSPADGTSYCQCAACKALDDPSSIEPSSGAVAMTNRYVNFFSDVGRRVGAVAPDSILSFYCYADYTQPPTLRDKLPPNLCAFIAPIRYCRMHGIGSPNCPQRMQQKEMIDGWAGIASKLGYYMYMYDLAEATVPLSMIARLKRDIPYLHSHGCIGMTQEVLTNWHIYGPHVHLGARLMYYPTADADAIMEDYFQKFYGPRAAPHMQAYWTAVDEAVSNLDCHCGSFFWVHLVYTPEFLARLGKLLDEATIAARDEPRYAERVALHAAGYQSAVEYTQMRAAMIRGEFDKAHEIYSGNLTRVTELAKRGWANPEYGAAYMKRFNGPIVEMGARLTAAPHRLLKILPDEWRLRYDPDSTGLDQGFAKPDLDESAWQTVSTFERPLSAQGLPDRREVMWYRTSVDLPQPPARLSLFFGEIDGLADVYVNGQKVTLVVDETAAPSKSAKNAPSPSAASDSARRRTPFEVDISAAVRPGKNLVAVRADHTRITELNLGGIIRPVYLIEKGESK